MGKGLACRGRCEADVKALIALVDASLRQSGTARGLMEGARRTGLIAAAFFTLLGALFVWYGIRSHAGFDLMSIMGAALLVYGAVHFMRMRRIAPVPKTPAP
jgi:hypothetical protein